eukprot:scaffold14769_cov116-Isochrysis_galbana.AAC.3
MFATVHAAGSSLFGLFSACTTTFDFDSTATKRRQSDSTSRNNGLVVSGAYRLSSIVGQRE